MSLSFDTSYRQLAERLSIANGSAEEQTVALLDKANTMKRFGTASAAFWGAVTCASYLLGASSRTVLIMGAVTLMATALTRKFHKLSLKIQPHADAIIQRLHHEAAPLAHSRLYLLQQVVEQTIIDPQCRECFKRLFTKLFHAQLHTLEVTQLDAGKQFCTVTLFEKATFTLPDRKSVMQLPDHLGFTIHPQGAIVFSPALAEPTIECTNLAIVKTSYVVAALAKNFQGYAMEAHASLNLLPLGSPTRVVIPINLEELL